MRVDLLAGTHYAPAAMILPPARRPTILIFDSGLGGLTVFSEVVRARPDARFIYAADDAVFPYGRLSEAELVARVTLVMDHLIRRHGPDLAVIACNTASTLVLPALRARFSLPFVGTVPAVKPAAERSRSRAIAVLATPGTVARDYTRDLVKAYAGDCRVTLVASHRLATFAEAELAGAPVEDAAIAAEIAPCFTEEGGRRTDAVVLACTHYPLLRPRLERLAPWPVAWIDPAPAIARRVTQLLGPAPSLGPASSETSLDAPVAVFTGGKGLCPVLRQALANRGLAQIVVEPVAAVPN